MKNEAVSVNSRSDTVLLGKAGYFLKIFVTITCNLVTKVITLFLVAHISNLRASYAQSYISFIGSITELHVKFT